MRETRAFIADGYQGAKMNFRLPANEPDCVVVPFTVATIGASPFGNPAGTVTFSCTRPLLTKPAERVELVRPVNACGIGVPDSRDRWPGSRHPSNTRCDKICSL